MWPTHMWPVVHSHLGVFQGVNILIINPLFYLVDTFLGTTYSANTHIQSGISEYLDLEDQNCNDLKREHGIKQNFSLICSSLSILGLRQE